MVCKTDERMQNLAELAREMEQTHHVLLYHERALYEGKLPV